MSQSFLNFVVRFFISAYSAIILCMIKQLYFKSIDTFGNRKVAEYMNK